MSHMIARTLLLSSILLAPSGVFTPVSAAELRLEVNPAQSHSAPLSRVTGERANITLSGRSPRIELRFDLSDAQIADNIKLTLAAKPLPGTDPTVPIVVRFNNGKPTRIDTLGLGFDTEVTLDARRARSRGNLITIEMETDCTDLGGGYVLSLDKSKLALDARAKQRRLQLREVEALLSQSVLAPKTVGLIASGPHATRLQALGAQAIGLRMTDLPDFKISTAPIQSQTSQPDLGENNDTMSAATSLSELDIEADYNLIMVTRSELAQYTSDPEILRQTGPRVTTDSAHPDRLFITGDTDLEVTQAVAAFASAFLPQTRRNETSPAEIIVQSPLDYERTRLSGLAKLDSLSVNTGAVRNYYFDVADPAATEGELLLRLKRDTLTPSGTRMKVELNGITLGETRLNTRYKAVAYSLPTGALQGSQNQLVLTTLDAPDQVACEATDPFVAIGTGSRLNLSTPTPSLPTDLSRVAADGSVFADKNGADTAVVLPDADADFEAALGLIAKLAYVSGRGWTEAQFVRGEVGPTQRHILSIEPVADIEPALSDRAPRALKAAWSGVISDGYSRPSHDGALAAAQGDLAMKIAMQRMQSSRNINSLGVAALFPGRNGQLIGIVSNMPGESFAKAMRPVITDAPWNALSGSVSRWDAHTAVMTQAALPAPYVPQPEGAEGRANWRDQFSFDIMDTDSYSLAAFGLPDVDMPRLDMQPVSSRISQGWTTLLNKVQPKTKVERPAEVEQPEAFRNANFELRAAHYPQPYLERESSRDLLRPALRKAETDEQRTARKSSAPYPQPYLLRTANQTAEGNPTQRKTYPELRGTIRAEQITPDVKADLPPPPARDDSERDLRSDIQQWLAQSRAKIVETTQNWFPQPRRVKSNLADKLKVDLPQMETIRIGRIELTPSLLVLLMAFILALIGLIFLSPPTRRR